MLRTVWSTALGLAVVGSLGTSPPAEAQWPPEKLENLQVLPEDISVREIVGIMRGFAGGLGVRCIYCHVGDDPNDLSTTNFVSDEKIEKRKAREMLRMVQRINGELLANVPERSDPPLEVECATCHHGVTQPRSIQAILADKATTDGAQAAIDEYDRLREEYYGSYSYDFRPHVLANVGEDIARQAPEAAVTILEYNTGLYPDNIQTYFTLAQIHAGSGDNEAAIRALERALEVDPDNGFVKQNLERLRNR